MNIDIVIDIVVAGRAKSAFSFPRNFSFAGAGLDLNSVKCTLHDKYCHKNLIIYKIHMKQVQRIYKKLDLDGDGIVNWDDFRAFLGKNPELLAIFLPQSTKLSID